MIYEVRTYTLKPGATPGFEKEFLGALPEREKVTKLGVLWKSEIGPLNQVIHVWPYESVEHRNESREAAKATGKWPPNTRQFVTAQETEIVYPVPFMGELQKPKAGHVYEMRSYIMQPGTIPEVIKRWSESVPERVKLSPLYACWYTELGTLNKFVHIWEYKDLNERARIREEAQRRGIWPPNTREFLVSMENKILLPANV